MHPAEHILARHSMERFDKSRLQPVFSKPAAGNGFDKASASIRMYRQLNFITPRYVTLGKLQAPSSAPVAASYAPVISCPVKLFGRAASCAVIYRPAAAPEAISPAASGLPGAY